MQTDTQRVIGDFLDSVKGAIIEGEGPDKGLRLYDCSSVFFESREYIECSLNLLLNKDSFLRLDDVNQVDAVAENVRRLLFELLGGPVIERTRRYEWGVTNAVISGTQFAEPLIMMPGGDEVSGWFLYQSDVLQPTIDWERIEGVTDAFFLPEVHRAESWLLSSRFSNAMHTIRSATAWPGSFHHQTDFYQGFACLPGSRHRTPVYAVIDRVVDPAVAYYASPIKLPWLGDEVENQSARESRYGAVMGGVRDDLVRTPYVDRVGRSVQNGKTAHVGMEGFVPAALLERALPAFPRGTSFNACPVLAFLNSAREAKGLPAISRRLDLNHSCAWKEGQRVMFQLIFHYDDDEG